MKGLVSKMALLNKNRLKKEVLQIKSVIIRQKKTFNNIELSLKNVFNYFTIKRLYFIYSHDYFIM